MRFIIQSWGRDRSIYKRDWLWARPPHEKIAYIFKFIFSFVSLWCLGKTRRWLSPHNTQRLQNSAENVERSVLTLCSLWLCAKNSVKLIFFSKFLTSSYIYWDRSVCADNEHSSNSQRISVPQWTLVDKSNCSGKWYPESLSFRALRSTALQRALINNYVWCFLYYVLETIYMNSTFIII